MRRLLLAALLLAPAAFALDFDGDGRADPAVFDAASGNWHVLRSQAGALVQNWGWSGTTPVPADYDGDGVADFAVYHAAAGNWYIRQSASNGTLRLRNWGWSAALPAPGDYDGDGRIDLCVYDPAAGSWYIRQSASNSALRLVRWGWVSGVPVPADYDSDGITDPAVYHPASGNWYVLGSASGRQLRFLGSPGASPVPGAYTAQGARLALFDRAAGSWLIQTNELSAPQALTWNGTNPAPDDYNGDGRTDIATRDTISGAWAIRLGPGLNFRFFQFGPVQALPVHPQFWLNRAYGL